MTQKRKLFFQTLLLVFVPFFVLKPTALTVENSLHHSHLRLSQKSFGASYHQTIGHHAALRQAMWETVQMPTLTPAFSKTVPALASGPILKAAYNSIFSPPQGFLVLRI